MSKARAHGVWGRMEQTPPGKMKGERCPPGKWVLEQKWEGARAVTENGVGLPGGAVTYSPRAITEAEVVPCMLW